MGQKVHPIGFRLGQTQTHSSQWFATKNNYSQFLLEDNFIRQMLLKYSKKIDKIQIIRKYGPSGPIEILIYTYTYTMGGPYNFLGFLSITQFSNLIKENIYKYRQSQFYQTHFGKNAPKDGPPKLTLRILSCQLNGSYIAQFLVDQLEKRTSYRGAINEFYRVLNYKKRKNKKKPWSLSSKPANNSGYGRSGGQPTEYDGLKIQISGRLNGAEIARSEWVREGRLPLQTLNAHIDYSFKKASTIYGILGVKVWVFKELIN
uniref:Small ribosomal subunit protein uS3c n=1 Tax=Caulerpa ashmeadii TaxID=177078 RepID=A0A6B9VXD6_9CHLO|nr:30S ribosomal protein S3 [Caulerpa ashmeadii]QHQ73315.1 30S ribosomal protein S3 [Caulerpa ashmeadii]